MSKYNNMQRIILACITIIIICTTVIMASGSNPTILTPTEDQYFELRAVEIKEVAGQNKQVTMELWGNNIEFKAFDVRFSYDGTKIQPSSIETNEVTDDETEYFKLEDEFKQCVEFFTIPYKENVIEGTLSFNPPVANSEHIIDKGEGIGKVISTNGGVRLGKMSFQMTADEFSTDWFHLVERRDRS